MAAIWSLSQYVEIVNLTNAKKRTNQNRVHINGILIIWSHFHEIFWGIRKIIMHCFVLFLLWRDFILLQVRILFFLRIQYITHNSAATWEWIQLLFYTEYFICTGNINRTLGNKIVDHSDVVGASPVGAAPTTSPFSTFFVMTWFYFLQVSISFFLRIQYITHNSAATWEWIQLLFYTEYFICTGNINRTLGNKIVDHSDVVGASPVGAAPTTSPFST